MNNHPIHSLCHECYACTKPPTRAYRHPNLATRFACEEHGTKFEEIFKAANLGFTKIAIVTPVCSLSDLRREFRREFLQTPITR